MFERFTDRARKAMQLANQEAASRGQECIGAEHILLGIVLEGGGVAANVLRNLEIDLRKIRLCVERKILDRLPIDGTTVGRLPLAPSAKRACEFAIAEAVDLDHNYVGTEHLTLGLLRCEENVAALVLAEVGVTREKFREEMLALIGQKANTTASPSLLRAWEAITKMSMRGRVMTIPNQTTIILRDQDLEATAVRLAAERFLTYWFGSRCDQFDPDCERCTRWAALDVLVGKPDDPNPDAVVTR